MRNVANRLMVVVAVVACALAPQALAQWNTNANDIYNSNSGNVGVGTMSPGGRLTVVDSGSGNTLFMQGRASDGTGGFQFRNNAGDQLLGYCITDSAEFRFFHISGLVSFYAAGVERMRVSAAGNVGIGTTSPTERLHVDGNMIATGTISGGNIAATYQDLAEWVPAREDLAPATVVVIDPQAINQVMASGSAYDTMVAGVVSAQPGLILGEAGDEKSMIATTGRVKVKVDATKAPIAIGDLLVTGEKPGTAMKSEPMEMNGRKFHQPGTLIGKALEPLAGGEGEILVLLSLQ